ncbi:MAG: hypothetical protein IJK63_08730 [Oscillospiraceae bacterium]|nr:hypothetical protein [Oscillospiraceae bacterium]
METLPHLSITLRPSMDASYHFKFCDVKMELETPELAAGMTLASLWKMVAGVPRCPLDPEGVSACDAAGALPLREATESSMGFEKTAWQTARATQGNVVLSYRFFPRDVSGIDRCYPIFDTICEENGALICGVTSLVTVPEKEYRFSLHWDRTLLPEGADVTAIKGNGDCEFVGKPNDYAFSLYLVGKIQCATDDSGKYRVLWLSEHLPDADRVYAQVPPLLREMCRFFRDEDLHYSIFFRKEPYSVSNSGTAFDGGFAYGFSDSMPLRMDEALNTLAHEIVHNWPQLENLQGESSWYMEGTAEYYSVMVPLRSGIVDAEQAAEWLTQKSVNYYNNRFQRLSNEEAYAKAWENHEIQRVPYGRGLFYLAHVDVCLKNASHGARCLDDLILELDLRRRRGETVRVSDWLQLVERELGQEAVDEFREIMSGRKMLSPEPEWFDGIFAWKRGDYQNIKQGSIENALIWYKK